MTSRRSTETSDQTPALYEVQVRGTLDKSWCDLAEGMTLTVARANEQPVTVLRMVLPDQAALAGLLDALFRLNVTVLSVNALEGAQNEMERTDG
jgi:hypothetical protein